MQLLERRAQVLKVLCFDGIDTCKDHGLYFLESLDGLVARAVELGDCVAHLDFGGSLYAAYDVAHVATVKGFAGRKLHFQHTNLVGVVILLGVDENNVVALAYRAVNYFEVGYYAAETVEHGVENQSLQGSALVTLRGGNPFHYGFENFVDTHACLSRSAYNLLAFAPQQVDYLVLNFIGHGVYHVAFVYYRDNGKVVLYCHVQVRYSLRLHALRGVDDEQCAFAGGYRAAHLVREVHVSRSVYKVERVLFAVVHVVHLYGMALYSNAAFPFKVHVVKHLPLGHFYRLGAFEQPVGQG